MNAELFTLVLPMLFIVFAVSRGARLIAGEEERGTLDVVLVTPVSKAHAAAVAAAEGRRSRGLGARPRLGAVRDPAHRRTGLRHGPRSRRVASGALAMSLLGIEFGFLSLAVAEATGRRAVALAVGGVPAVGGYVLYALEQIVESV